MGPAVVLVEEVRDGCVQAVHEGYAVLLRGDGTRQAWGDPDAAAWCRSTPKPLQALSFVRSGAADAAGLGENELALACASHSGESEHLAAARRILASAGLTEDALQCGAHRPAFPDAGPPPPGGWTPLHNNCSGKHAAMLAASVAMGWDPATYTGPAHPLQQAIVADLIAATGVTDVPLGTDGCGLPTFWLPLAALARTYQWLDGAHGGPAAGRRCLDAMATNAWWVGGTGRFDSAFIAAGRGSLVSKVGASGVHVALHRPSGDALAVKLQSGRGDAAEVLVAALADHAGWLDEAMRGELAPYLDKPVETWLGRRLGSFVVRL